MRGRNIFEVMNWRQASWGYIECSPADCNSAVRPRIRVVISPGCNAVDVITDDLGLEK
ncbi:MAG: hypothetical protein M2R45_03523 [Verrucomicrobia subdivision 3 bacterium]|nr:hypothetical protein [Limisphaerales bacterium]MCS1415920.1 hypothetical protein [Limisphaerales bacterium]